MSDPYFSSVELLLHFNGSPRSLSIVDSSNRAHSITNTFNGGANNAITYTGALSADVTPVFGSTCAYATSGLQVSGTAAAIPTGDFTVEFFVYGQNFDFKFQSYDGVNGQEWTDLSGTSTGVVLSTYRNAGGGGTLGTSTTAPTANAWNYIVFQRSGSTTSVYLNSGSPLISTTTALILGSSQNSGGGILYGYTLYAGGASSAYLDEFRYTVGVARYSGGISTPTAPFESPVTVGVSSAFAVSSSAGAVGVVNGGAVVVQIFGGVVAASSGNMVANDPYFSNVQLLLHFEGANNATTIVDSSSHNYTVPFTGNITDNYAAFGTSSAENGSSITFNGNSALLPTGDFTIEFFIFGIQPWSVNFGGGASFGYAIFTSVYKTYIDPGVFANSTLVTGTTLVDNVWNFVVCQRKGSTTTISVNNGSPVLTNTNALSIGTTYVSFGAPTAQGAGYPYAPMDELRYTVGAARYPGGVITTPTTAFPGSSTVSIPSPTYITSTAGSVGIMIGTATIVSLASAGQTIATSPGAVGFAPSPVVTVSGLPITLTPGTVGRGYPVTALSAIVSTAGAIPSIAVTTAPLTGAGVTVSPGGVGATTPTNISVPLTSGTGITVNSGTPVAVNLTALLVTISGALPTITGSIDILASVAPYFTISGALPQISGNIYAFANITTFVINGALQAVTSVWGYIHGSLPPFVAISEAQAVFNGQVTYAMNIKTAETTQYANYNFLSIIRLGTSYYGVRSDGIYLLGGSVDITQPIQAGFTTAQSTLGSTSIKHVPFLYMDAQNPATVMQITDTETAGPFFSHPTGLKTKLSRGIRGKIWQFKVSNVNGNQFRIGALEALSEITSHRVK